MFKEIEEELKKIQMEKEITYSGFFGKIKYLWDKITRKNNPKKSIILVSPKIFKEFNKIK